jgi:hypothetical protein
MTKFISTMEKKEKDDNSHIELFNSNYEKLDDVSDKTQRLTAVCKIVHRSNGGKVHYIKWNSRDRLVYNPHTDNLEAVDNRKRSNDSQLFKFEKVSQDVYNKYVEFLSKPTTYMFKQVNVACKRK